MEPNLVDIEKRIRAAIEEGKGWPSCEEMKQHRRKQDARLLESSKVVRHILKDYERGYLHYNLIAGEVYKYRRTDLDNLTDFSRFIIYGLIGFDMGRMLGKRKDIYWGDAGFGNKLRKSLRKIRPQLTRLAGAGDLINADFKKYRKDVKVVYQRLSSEGQLHHKDFHVGATKILHWLIPDLFLMVDRNSARAYRKYLGINYRDTTQPGYSADKYLECLMLAQCEIQSFGEQEFRKISSGTPLARTFDKIAFMLGQRPESLR